MRRESKFKSGERKFLRLVATFSLSLVCLTVGGQTNSTAPTNAVEGSAGEVLELLDGSLLHGRLRAIDSSKGLTWEHPEAKQPFDFKPENLAWVRFPRATALTAPTSQTTCQFRFANGDEFFGNLIALNETELELETWFGGRFKTPRASLRSIRFFPKGVATVYEGPTGIEDWKLGKNQTPKAWRYSEGAFIANSAGTLGRDLQLPEASRLEFDLAWNAPFSLLFSYYTGVFDTFNYNSSSYMFYINPGSVSLQRINAGSGSATLGRTETIMPMLAKKNVHMEFRGSKAESLIELLVDGKLVNQWKDSAGWVGKGSGILFYAQTDGADVKISNIKVSEWDGNSGGESGTNAPVTEDQIHLANRDKVSGKLTSLQEGKLKITTPAAALDIPMQRVTQVLFSGETTNANPLSPWEIQASVSGGGKISFALEKWDNEKIFGRNKNFGPISLNSATIRQIRFNPGKAKTEESGSPSDVIWEVNEP